MTYPMGASGAGNNYYAPQVNPFAQPTTGMPNNGGAYPTTVDVGITFTLPLTGPEGMDSFSYDMPTTGGMPTSGMSTDTAILLNNLSQQVMQVTQGVMEWAMQLTQGTGSAPTTNTTGYDPTTGMPTTTDTTGYDPTTGMPTTTDTTGYDPTTGMPTTTDTTGYDPTTGMPTTTDTTGYDPTTGMPTGGSTTTSTQDKNAFGILSENFEALDRDGSGFLERSEIEAAAASEEFQAHQAALSNIAANSDTLLFADIEGTPEAFAGLNQDDLAELESRAADGQTTVQIETELREQISAERGYDSSYTGFQADVASERDRYAGPSPSSEEFSADVELRALRALEEANPSSNSPLFGHNLPLNFDRAIEATDDPEVKAALEHIRDNEEALAKLNGGSSHLTGSDLENLKSRVENGRDLELLAGTRTSANQFDSGVEEGALEYILEHKGDENLTSEELLEMEETAPDEYKPILAHIRENLGNLSALDNENDETLSTNELERLLSQVQDGRDLESLSQFS